MSKYSLIIPVFNRPEELGELLDSIIPQTFRDFEVIVVEDGSTVSSENLVKFYTSKFQLKYLKKGNSGPGLSRNYGADKASGTFLIFIDSDCILPPNYLQSVDEFLAKNDLDVYGGPDRAHESFSVIQKAINYSMTSFLTTGGIRGGKKQLERFKPRSFNMGISRDAFQELKGFNAMRFGEDIDFSIRLERHNYKMALINEAFVYHKRRTSFSQFFKQVYNSGIARIHLSHLHKGSLKLVHFLPSAFLLFCLTFCILAFINLSYLIPLGAFIFFILVDSSWSNKSVVVGGVSVIASFVQLIGYGLGFIKSLFASKIMAQKPKFSFEENYYD